jgi:DNA-3-methyladenine glycosylase
VHRGAGGVIVETEAYREDDPASHSHRGPRGRAAVMFGPPGRLYVYRSYGLHWCVNVVCEPEGRGAAVLIRALAPARGVDAMRARRGEGRPLAAGPGRLTEALAIDGSHDGLPAVGPGAALTLTARLSEPPLVSGPRIGISVARELPWRFGHAGSPHLSRPFPPGDES